MNFIDIKKENLLDYMETVMKSCIDNSKEIIKENILYAPSIQIADIFDESEYEFGWKCADKNWLYSLFSIRFLYWKDKELLGIMGCLPKNIKKNLTSIPFQNSTDQDYEYKSWAGITYFENVVEEVQNMNLTNMIDAYNSISKVYLTNSDIKNNEDSDVNYYKRSLVYKKIYDGLNLDKWQNYQDGNYKQYTMNSISNDWILFELYAYMKLVLKEEWKKLEE